MNEAYMNTEQFKQQDAGSYDPVADDFDQFEERFSAHLPARIISLARLRAGQKVLDVGSGTGLVAAQVAQAVGSEGEAVGIDLSEGMLAVARKKAQQSALSDRLSFQKMDAENLEFSDCYFDAVVSLYALRHFPDPLRALQEMHRVVRPGSRVVVGIGSAPPLVSHHGVVAGMRKIGDIVLESLGKQLVACKFLDNLIARSLPDSSNTEETAWTQTHGSSTNFVPSLLRKAGFTEVGCTWYGQRALIESSEEFWRLQVTFSSFARKRVGNASQRQVEALRKEFMDICGKVQRRGGKLIYPTGTLFVYGIRPQ